MDFILRKFGIKFCPRYLNCVQHKFTHDNFTHHCERFFPKHLISFQVVQFDTLKTAELGQLVQHFVLHASVNEVHEISIGENCKKNKFFYRPTPARFARLLIDMHIDRAAVLNVTSLRLELSLGSSKGHGNLGSTQTRHSGFVHALADGTIRFKLFRFDVGN